MSCGASWNTCCDGVAAVAAGVVLADCAVARAGTSRAALTRKCRSLVMAILQRTNGAGVLAGGIGVGGSGETIGVCVAGLWGETTVPANPPFGVTATLPPAAALTPAGDAPTIVGRLAALTSWLRTVTPVAPRGSTPSLCGRPGGTAVAPPA